MFVPISRSLVADRYELIEEIGRGGMGVVWRARHLHLGSDCAVKFIHANHAHDGELRQRFVREARAAARLQSPHSVQVLDVDEWQGSLFIAMELLSGETLESRLEREGTLSAEFTVEVLTQAARGLDKAHASRLVHRDLKPENIFLVEDRPLLVKLVDFGIAKHLDASSGLRTASGALLGTPAYMSPEQADGGKPVDHRSDLWSLALVAFRCLTGSNLFDADGLGQLLVKVLQAPIPAPSSRNPQLSAAVDEWWFSVLQRDPALRPGSASELVAGLRKALETAPPRHEAAAPPRAASAKQVTLEPISAGGNPRPSKSRLSAGVLTLAALGAAALLWAQWRARSSAESTATAPARQDARALGAAPASATLLPAAASLPTAAPPPGVAAPRSTPPSTAPTIRPLALPAAAEPAPTVGEVKQGPVRPESAATRAPRVQRSEAARRPVPPVTARTEPAAPAPARASSPAAEKPVPAPSAAPRPSSDDPRLGF